jgi:hypothetical protein
MTDIITIPAGELTDEHIGWEALITKDMFKSLDRNEKWVLIHELILYPGHVGIINHYDPYTEDEYCLTDTDLVTLRNPEAPPCR